MFLKETDGRQKKVPTNMDQPLTFSMKGRVLSRPDSVLAFDLSADIIMSCV